MDTEDSSMSDEGTSNVDQTAAVGAAVGSTSPCIEPRRRLFHFSYAAQEWRAEPPLHLLRDGDAFAEIQPALLQEYSYHGLILNFPEPDPATAIPGLRPTDLVVLTTRPPTRNEKIINKKYISQSGTYLERRILETVGRYFEAHSRSLIKLTSDMATKLCEPTRGEIEFFQRHGARYRRYRVPYTKRRDQSKWQVPARPNLTAAFLLSTDLPENNGILLNVFGMDGPTR